jgi:hypothetical protein
VLTLVVFYIANVVKRTQEPRESSVASKFFVEIFVVNGAFNKIDSGFPAAVQFVIFEIGVKPVV